MPPHLSYSIARTPFEQEQTAWTCLQLALVVIVLMTLCGPGRAKHALFPKPDLDSADPTPADLTQFQVKLFLEADPCP